MLYYEQEMEENFPLNTPQNQKQKKGSAVFDFIKFIFIVAVIVIPVRFWVAYSVGNFVNDKIVAVAVSRLHGSSAD